MGDVQVVYWEPRTRWCSFSIMGGVLFLLTLGTFLPLYTSRGLRKCACPDSGIQLCGEDCSDIHSACFAWGRKCAECRWALAPLIDIPIDTVLPLFLPCLRIVHFITWQRSLKCHLRDSNIVNNCVILNKPCLSQSCTSLLTLFLSLFSGTENNDQTRHQLFFKVVCVCVCVMCGVEYKYQLNLQADTWLDVLLSAIL